MKFGQTSANRSKRAFTMVEIAIAVGVIGFAVVAIVGILPRGMNTQKDNREDTTISEDAPYFLNVIRNGEMRTNNSFLANYIESISVSTFTNGTSNFYFYTNPNFTGGGYNYLTNDMNIVGLLSTPEFDARFPAPGVTNQVTAIVRAASGSAIQQNGLNEVTAFKYQLTVENVPWNSISFDSTNFNFPPPPNSPYVPGSPDWIIRSNRYYEVQYLTNNLHEIRLKFAWPVLPNGNIGPNRQTYRCLASSHLLFTNLFGTTLWFFQPNSYTNYIYAP